MKGYGTDQKNGSACCKYGCCGRGAWDDCLSVRHGADRARRALAKRARREGKEEAQEASNED